MNKPYDYDHFRRAKVDHNAFSLTAEWGAALKWLPGQRLHAVHAQWEDGNLSDRGWWNNGPVIFAFENAQLDLFASKGGMSVAVDAYNLDLEETIGEPGDETYVIWRTNPWLELQAGLQQPLQSLRAIEGTNGGCEPRIMGITLQFAKVTICLYEGGDQMSLTWGTLPNDPNLRWSVGMEFSSE